MLLICCKIMLQKHTWWLADAAVVAPSNWTSPRQPAGCALAVGLLGDAPAELAARAMILPLLAATGLAPSLGAVSWLPTAGVLA